MTTVSLCGDIEKLFKRLKIYFELKAGVKIKNASIIEMALLDLEKKENEHGRK